MNRNEYVIRLLAYIGSFVAATAIVYIPLCFIELEFNPIEWSVYSRIFFSLAECFLLYASVREWKREAE